MAELNCHNFGGHYAGHYPLASPRLNVHNANHYGFCIDTNTHNQLNTSVTDLPVHPDAGNIVFWTCRCQLPFDNCGVDASLVDNTSVLFILDFIESLDVVNSYQVVFVHNLRDHSSGFYYIYQDNDSSVFLHIYRDKDLGPFQVVGSSLTNVVFCNQTLAVDVNVDLTPNQIFDDYKKDLWSRVNYNMDYTQYIEAINNELCISMDLQPSEVDLEVLDTPNDAIATVNIPNSITALLDTNTIRTPQIDHDVYIPSKTVGFLSHEDTSFEFIGPDRPPVSLACGSNLHDIFSNIHTNIWYS